MGGVEGETDCVTDVSKKKKRLSGKASNENVFTVHSPSVMSR